MSILPGEVLWTFEVASLDISVPDNLINQKDNQEWSVYLESQPVDRLLEKFAIAVDQFLALEKQTADYSEFTENQKIYLYSKWLAARAASGVIQKKLGYPVSFDEQKKYKTEIGTGLFVVIDALYRLQSADLPDWVARHRSYGEFENGKDRKNLSGLINAMEQKASETRNPALYLV